MCNNVQYFCNKKRQSLTKQIESSVNINKLEFIALFITIISIACFMCFAVLSVVKVFVQIQVKAYSAIHRGRPTLTYVSDINV